MTPSNDPRRITEEPFAPASLRRAVRLAAQIEPTPQEMRQLRSSLALLHSTTTSRRPAGVGTDTHSRLVRWPRRKMLVGARVAAALVAACVSVTWAGVRYWGSTAALRSWITLGDTAERAAPPPPPAPAHHHPIAAEHSPAEVGTRPTVAVPFAPSILVLPDHLARSAPKRGKAHALAPVDGPPVAQPSPAAVEAAPPEAPSEARILLQARRALRVDPAQTLRWVREHEHRFPDGSLRQEREVLAIEALRGIGRPAEADARLVRFRERYPGTIHDRRIDNRAGNRARQDGPAPATSELNEVGATQQQNP